jgi:molybdopterin-synthase adenylyltransferase
VENGCRCGLVYKFVMLYNSFMRDDLAVAIRAASTPSSDGANISISGEAVRRLADDTGSTALEIECAALEIDIVPARYTRNMGTIGTSGQLKLLRSCMGVCGLGGLGGYIVELLARFGVGHLILVDGDSFEEDNLNRQLFCTEAGLGRRKSEAAEERVAAVNSSLEVTSHHLFAAPDDIPEVFRDADLVMDALDSVASRLALERGCAKLGIPLVHGAIAGTSGQVMTIFPGDPGLKSLYAGSEDPGAEVLEGNPPTTPALVAALQVQEAVKVACGGELLRRGFLVVDIAANLYQFISME